jgi:hypothetical protein
MNAAFFTAGTTMTHAARCPQVLRNVSVWNGVDLFQHLRRFFNPLDLCGVEGAERLGRNTKNRCARSNAQQGHGMTQHRLLPILN